MWAPCSPSWRARRSAWTRSSARASSSVATSPSCSSSTIWCTPGHAIRGLLVSTACGSPGSRPFLSRPDPPTRPVLLLHGLGATSSSFLTTLWDLSVDHRVLALDLPGFGETDKPLVPLRPALVALQAPERVDRLGLLAPSMAWRRFRAAAFVVRLLRHELAIVPLPILHRGRDLPGGAPRGGGLLGAASSPLPPVLRGAPLNVR